MNLFIYFCELDGNDYRVKLSITRYVLKQLSGKHDVYDSR